jgi:tagatose 1,6-diphosphate aldolase
MEAHSVQAGRLTVGKLRGLQQLVDERGVFTMLALDHRASLRRALNPTAPAQVPYEAMVELKLLLTRALAPHASAVLLDPTYGAAQAISQWALPGEVGLIVSLEASGYEGEPTARLTALIEGWDVAKIKLMGASAVKMLLYYHPAAASARQQQVLAAGVAESCRIHDIPLLLGPLSYALSPATAPKGSPAFAQELPQIVSDTVRRLVPAGVDLLEAEFPSDLQYDSPETALAHCLRLSEASAAPWVVLSAGADYERFLRQVEIACRGGASGFLAGRAVWQEMTRLPREEWEGFAATTAVERFLTLAEVARAEGRAYRPTVPIGLGWLDTYGRRAEPVPAALAD